MSTSRRINLGQLVLVVDPWRRFKKLLQFWTHLDESRNVYNETSTTRSSCPKFKMKMKLHRHKSHNAMCEHCWCEYYSCATVNVSHDTKYYYSRYLKSQFTAHYKGNYQVHVINCLPKYINLNKSTPLWKLLGDLVCIVQQITAENLNLLS